MFFHYEHILYSLLGVTPYPGITVNDAFYRMIESGYHMEQPFYAEESV